MITTTVLNLAQMLFPKQDFNQPVKNLPDETIASILSEMPLESSCGDSCAIALMGASIAIRSFQQAHGDHYDERTIQTIANAADACLTFIRG